LLNESRNIKEFLNRYLITVEKPGRYSGGEFNQKVKSWSEVDIHVALAFPDIYDIGLPNLGLAILYDEINRRVDALAERVYCPWMDMEKLMRDHHIPLYTLESKIPLREFDILGFSVPYETLYTNLLNMLDLGGIPIKSKDRSDSDPLIIAGGHACYNPEPLHAFVDAFVIGEGEEIVHEIISVYKEFKNSQKSRHDLLLRLKDIPGIYIPSFFKITYFKSGLIKEVVNLQDANSPQVKKRIVKKLPPPITDFFVPNIHTVNERVVVEIMRGCSRGCRFCQAGMITRPVRERPVSEVMDALKTSIEKTGFTDISLLSLSTSDHSQISTIIKQVMDLSTAQNLSFSLPSLRVESFDPVLIATMQGKRKGNFTIAPEAGTENMRKRINKPIPAADISNTATEIFKMGWTNLKLYFMIGFPDETIEDVQEIITLCKNIKSIGRRLVGGRAIIHISINTLIPKSHTPFQWSGFAPKEHISEKYHLIEEGLKKTGIKIDWPYYENSLLEAWLSRGDRRLSAVIEKAWRNGAKFDAWHECYDHEKWMQAFEKNDLNPDFYSIRERSKTEIFPWEHINIGVTKKYLFSEYKKSRLAQTTEDCRNVCHACGIQTEYQINCTQVREAG